MGLADSGVIEPGRRGDLLITNRLHTEIHAFGASP